MELNRTEVSQCFGVAATTIDSWIQKGCPIESRGGKGIPSRFDTAKMFQWYRDNVVPLHWNQFCDAMVNDFSKNNDT